MSQPKLSGIHHVKIPVTDLARSRAWYKSVFGLRVTMEFPEEDGVVRGLGGVVAGLGEVGLCLRLNPKAAEGSQGFDPVSFGVDDRTDIEAWMSHLDNLGVGHSPLIEASKGWLLVFNDPDGLELHLYSWAEHGLDHSNRPGYGRAVTEES